MKSNCLYDSEQKFKPILCKSQTKILSFSSVQKKKKPTDRPNPKTMGRVTANKLFIKDGLIEKDQRWSLSVTLLIFNY